MYKFNKENYKGSTSQIIEEEDENIREDSLLMTASKLSAQNSPNSRLLSSLVKNDKILMPSNSRLQMNVQQPEAFTFTTGSKASTPSRGNFSSPSNTANKNKNYRQTINMDNLINICSKKLEIEPNHKKALYIRASSFLKKGLFNEAIKDCNKLITMEDNNVGAFYIRGCALEKLGNVDKAIEDFSKVLNLDPNHANAAFARGACLNRKGYFMKAIEDYNMALEIDGEKQMILSSCKKSRRPLLEGKNSMHLSRVDKDTTLSSDIGSISPLTEKRGMAYQHGSKKMQSSNEDDLVHPLNNEVKFLKMDSSMISNPREVKRVDSAASTSIANVLKSKSMKSNIEDTPDNNGESSKIKGQTNKDAESTKAYAEWYHSQGFEARKKGDFPLAIELYTKALEIFPKHFKALFNRGFAFDKLGEYDLAIADYTKALAIDQKNAYAYYNRGISLDRKNDFEEAIKNFTIAISLDPDKADFYHNRAFAYRKKKNYELAIADYSMAIDMDPSHFKAYYNRAFCFDKVGSLNEAETDYKKAIDVQPQNINAIYHLGCLLEKMGNNRLPEALNCLNEVVIIDSKYSPGYNARGLVWDKLQNYEAAYSDFTNAMELEPENPVFIHNRACCLRNMGRLRESIEDFAVALELDSSNPIIYSNLGLVWRKLDEYDKAIEAYNNEIIHSSENSKTLNNRAYCFAKLTKYKEAVSDYTKALTLDPKNIHSLHNRGICYERMGLYRNAIEDFSAVISLNNSNANAYFNRGCCYDSIGELDLAISDYSTALEIDSKNSKK